MSGTGKAGNGGGNSRRRPSRRRDRNDNNRQNQSAPARGESSSRADAPHASAAPRGGGGAPRNLAGAPQRRGERRPQRNPAPGSEAYGRHSHRGGFFRKVTEHHRKEKGPVVDRPKWVPPKISADPLPVPDCPWCGEPIRDISSAIADKNTGVPVHFECVAARIAEGETLEKGDAVTYIGGGRFGVVYFGAPGDSRAAARDWKIKKIIEWENKEMKAEWRSLVCDRYSVT